MWSHQCLASGRRPNHVVTPGIPGLTSVFVRLPGGREREAVGIREAKAQLSALARAAANGEPTLLTDYGEPRAVITSIKSDAAGQAVGISDPSEFKQRLLALPYALEVNF
jgi:prevent-host-death family protein